MDRELIRDLARWERGELPLDALRAAHGARAGGLVDLHGRLAALGAGPLPPADVAWAELAPMLPTRGAVPPFPARRLPRALVAAAVALVLALGVAAPRPVRHQLLSFLERVGAALGLEEGRPDAHTPATGSFGAGAPTPASSQGSGATATAIDEDGGAAEGGPREGDHDDGGTGGPAEDGDEGALEDEDADADEGADEEGADGRTGGEEAGDDDRHGAAPEEEPEGAEDGGSPDGDGEGSEEEPQEGGEDAGSDG